MATTIYFLRDGKVITRTSGIKDPDPIWDDRVDEFDFDKLFNN